MDRYHFRGEAEFPEEECVQGAAQHQARVQNRLNGVQQVEHVTFLASIALVIQSYLFHD